MILSDPGRKAIYIQYTNPPAYPSLEHSSRILADRGWEVLFLGTGALGADNLEFPPHPRIRVLRRPYCPPGWRQKVDYLQYTLWVLAWALRWRPRWVYASDPMSTPVALLLSYLPGMRVIYHEHDTPGYPQPNAPSTDGARAAISPFMRFVFRCRARLAQRAELCILPSERRAEYFARTVANGRPVITVWNCPRREEVISSPKPEPGNDLRILYHGSIVPARLPLTVVEALAKLPDEVRLTVIGYETVGHQGYVEELKETARRLKIEDRVQFLGPMPRYELMEHCRECDVGLALMPKNADNLNFRHMIGASNKPFDYLACGLALLVSDLPDWVQTYVEPGYGLACDPKDPESIAAAIRWFLDHPEEMRAMGARGRQRILEEWNYEQRFEPVYQTLSRVT